MGWYICYEIVNFISVITNCYLLCVISTKLHTFVPIYYQDYIKDTDFGRFIVMVILEHILIFFKIILMVVIDDIPLEIQKQTEINENKLKELTIKTKLRLFSLEN